MLPNFFKTTAKTLTESAKNLLTNTSRFLQTNRPLHFFSLRLPRRQ